MLASPGDLSRRSSSGHRGITRLPLRRRLALDAWFVDDRYAIYIRIVARTREGLGRAVNPHLFRDCAATSVAIDDPAHVGIASRLLGHRTGSTTERYYNLAGSVEASRLMQKSLVARRSVLLDGSDPTEHASRNAAARTKRYKAHS